MSKSRPLTLGVVMDPIRDIKPYKDTTLAMLLAAQARGWKLLYMEQADLYLLQGEARARYRELTVRDDKQDWHSFGPEHDGPLGRAMDLVLMRKDPPFDIEYIYSTYILERAEAAGVRVVNRPQSLRDANEKGFTAWFPQCCPPTLMTRDMARMRAFVKEHHKVVVKPLDGMGGSQIFVLSEGDPNVSVALETLTDSGKRLAMAQLYLPEIKAGDKRILVIDGEPVPYALARVPAPGESRGNLAAGGKGVGVALTERDRWLVSQVAPTLREKGLLFVGLDVIGDWLTEINVTSPTCVRELDALYKLDIAGQFMDMLAAKLKADVAPSTAATPRLDSPSVTARDRLVTTLFFAALLHGIIILGITFRPEKPAGSPTLEVTMVQSRSVTPPDDAQYLAQANQRGAGNTEELVRPESSLSMPAALSNSGRADAPDLDDNPGRNVSSGKRAGQDKAHANDKDAAVTTTAVTGSNANARAVSAPLSLEPRIMMARLLTPGDNALMPTDDGVQLPQATDPSPRESFVSVNARESRFAPYLDAWRRKVERIGNLNFPPQIRTQHLTGSLSLEVALNADGGIRQLSLVSPSGQPVLDDSAQRIVKLAAPYQPFPANIRRDTAVLRFVYVWRFNGGKLDTRHSSIKSAASGH